MQREHEIWDGLSRQKRSVVMRVVTVIAAATMLLCAQAGAYAQDAVPLEILSRTVFIKQKGSNDGGSAFTLDYKGKLYLVTARHVIEGIAGSGAIIEVRRSDKWEDYHTVKTLYPSSADADIAVFRTDETAAQPFGIAPAGTSTTVGVSLGQQVWFIGYPFGMISVPAKGSTITELPFMKRGSMSAVDASNPEAVVYYIDGFNNPGFSGGPVLYWEFATHTYKILAVVKGYRNDTAKILINGKQVETNILVNSGILVSYSIQHAIDAIEKNLAPGAPH
jgi:S1-C subfamily serine protease